MKKNDKKADNEETTMLLLSQLSQLSQLSPHSSPSSSDESGIKSVCNGKEQGEEQGGVINTILACPSITLDEIVSTIVKHVQEADIYQLTYWDNMRKFTLKHTITNIHNHNENENEYLKDLIMYKKYDACNVNSTGEFKYGMFRHKYFNLMFRIDDINDQISGEDIVSSRLMKRYNNRYQDIIRLGIVIPVHCYIKLSTPQLFYSVQPYISNTITLDAWIGIIKHKGNFDEQVYDVFMQLCGMVKELHEVECVHGDIKPANILIGGGGIKHEGTSASAFLIDYGLSGIHNNTTNASGGTIPFCAPETENTISNKKNGNNVIKCPQKFEYNWVKHKKSHDIWSLGFIFMTIYIFKTIKLYYHEYPSDFFLSAGYISPKYLNMIQHEYIREILSKHILVEPSNRCDCFELNNLVSNLTFM
jgi:serine/threonine protein kinase